MKEEGDIFCPISQSQDTIPRKGGSKFVRLS